MTDQLKKLSGIASLEASIAQKTASLKAAQASWDDWKAGTYVPVLVKSLLPECNLDNTQR
jgi:hypothetical protein